eukprot:134612_1
MTTLLLILIATLHCAAAHQCEPGQLFCITKYRDLGKVVTKMHWKASANQYGEKRIGPLQRFAVRRKDSRKSIHVVSRTPIETYQGSGTYYFRCDRRSCDEKTASLIIDSVFKEGGIVNLEEDDDEDGLYSLEYVLENKGGLIIRHKPTCAVDGHVSIAAFCIDDSFDAHVSLPLPVLTNKAVQLQKGDQLIIPSYLKGTKTSPKETFVCVGIKKESLIRHQWEMMVEGKGTKKKYTRSVVDAINEALRHRVKPIALSRGGKIMCTITAEGGYQTAGRTAHAASDYEDILQDVADDDNEFLRGFEDGYRAAERLLTRG